MFVIFVLVVIIVLAVLCVLCVLAVLAVPAVLCVLAVLCVFLRSCRRLLIHVSAFLSACGPARAQATACQVNYMVF